MKTSELTGAALDWAVAKCENFDARNNYRVWVMQEDCQLPFDCYANDWEHAYERARDVYPNNHIAAVELLEIYSPSTNWSHGGPIIEREKIQLLPSIMSQTWNAACPHSNKCVQVTGPTPLIAAMRCYVTLKLGNEIELPKENENAK